MSISGAAVVIHQGRWWHQNGKMGGPVRPLKESFGQEIYGVGAVKGCACGKNDFGLPRRTSGRSEGRGVQQLILSCGLY